MNYSLIDCAMAIGLVVVMIAVGFAIHAGSALRALKRAHRARGVELKALQACYDTLNDLLETKERRLTRQEDTIVRMSDEKQALQDAIDRFESAENRRQAQRVLAAQAAGEVSRRQGQERRALKVGA